MRLYAVHPVSLWNGTSVSGANAGRLGEGEGGTWSNVPMGNAIECVARRPDARDAFDEECPERGNGNMSRTIGVEFGLRLEEICEDVSVYIIDISFSIGFGKGEDGVRVCIKDGRG